MTKTNTIRNILKNSETSAGGKFLTWEDEERIMLLLLQVDKENKELRKECSVKCN